MIAIELSRSFHLAKSARSLAMQEHVATVVASAFSLNPLSLPIKVRRFIFLKEKPMGEFIAELWNFMKERKKFWLLHILVVLLLFGTLIVLTQGSAVAPFIYTLF